MEAARNTQADWPLCRNRDGDRIIARTEPNRVEGEVGGAGNGGSKPSHHHPAWCGYRPNRSPNRRHLPDCGITTVTANKTSHMSTMAHHGPSQEARNQHRFGSAGGLIPTCLGERRGSNRTADPRPIGVHDVQYNTLHSRYYHALRRIPIRSTARYTTREGIFSREKSRRFTLTPSFVCLVPNFDCPTIFSVIESA